MKPEARLEYVPDAKSPKAQTFLRLAKPYMAETDPEGPAKHAPFLQSILRRQGEPARWLALFMLGDDVAGFAHFRIDNDERPGWGYVLEYYVVPTRRRQGLGRQYLSLILDVLAAAGCQMAWLASHPAAEGFWHACGFRETGEFERDQKIMTKALIFHKEELQT